MAEASDTCGPVYSKWPVVLMVVCSTAFGLGLLGFAIWSAQAWCPDGIDSKNQLCRAVFSHPPWNLLTAAAASLGVILTWYWRTMKREEQAALDRRQAIREQDVAQATLQQHAHQEFLASMREAVGLVDSGKHSSALAGIRILVRLARSGLNSEGRREDAVAALETLNDIRRRIDPDREGFGSPGDREIIEAIDAATTRLNYEGADLAGANLPGAKLTLANLSGANLSDSNLLGAKLTDANLSGANLSDANLPGANLAGADLSRANVRYANLLDADASGARLRGADLGHANLRRVDLSQADLYRARFFGATLSRAKLTDADLSHVEFFGADLTEANLSGANLSDANLPGAKLTDANLSGANLSGADLDSAHCNGANFSDAEIDGVKNAVECLRAAKEIL